ncbi:MAG: hypothetical protein NVS3B10_05140 [Polyangiales bacterium]
MSAAKSALLAVGLLCGATLAARPAHADAAVVGVSDRHAFGRWAWTDAPRVTMGFGTSLHFVPFDGATLYGGTKAAPISGPARALDGTGIVATTFDIRPRFFLAGPVYVGPTFMLGPGFRRGAPTTPGTVHAGSAGLFFEGGAVIGVAGRPGGGPINVFAARLGGRRLASLSVQDDTPGLAAAHAAYSALLVQAALVPRLGLDVWTNPYGTLGGWVGVDALHPSAWSVGFAMSLHLAPYDSGPS